MAASVGAASASRVTGELLDEGRAEPEPAPSGGLGSGSLASCLTSHSYWLIASSSLCVGVTRPLLPP